MKRLLLSFLFLPTGVSLYAQDPLFRSDAYSIYQNKVVQGKNTATAISPKQMVSNYQSPANEFQSADIIFKFSINGRDNEMFMGKNHHFSVHAVNGVSETPLIKFGQQLDQPAVDGKFLLPNTALKIWLDMKDVMRQFKEQGFYTTILGDKIYKEDFKGVYVAGPTAPMTWDFDNIMQREDLKLKDPDADGIYEVTLVLNKQSDGKHTDAEWMLGKDISPYPQYKSDFVISDAIYNLSLEEMLKAIEPDSTFRTGKEWSGVWTRDISYSIILSMAHLQPRVAMFSLMRKVNAKKKIIQDTGTGGAWPISTDRMIWAVAAWEIYKATGNKDWLQQAYTIIRNSVEDDIQAAHDPETGLVKGESSFLDWREQTYPKWMQPADIYESQCLGTNAVHYQANHVLSQMATALKDSKAAMKYQGIAERIKKGINEYLWLPEKGYYAQFRYGRNYKFVSPRAEALGEALCVIFGIADEARAKQVVASTPVTVFGIPCIFPQIPNIPPYHNNAVWPFVQTYWLWAAAKAGNERAVSEGIFSIYRPAALFLTNKENFVVDNGDFNGTQINSSVMLWSLSGNISIVQKVFFGIRFNAGNISFEPFVPKVLDGKRWLENFRYRDAVLDIEMEGFGNVIRSFIVDGKVMPEAMIPEILKGKHDIKIILAGNTNGHYDVNLVNNMYSLPSPAVIYDGTKLWWDPVKGAKAYRILQNGKLLTEISKTSFTVPSIAFAEYAVIALDDNNVESFASEPQAVSKGNDFQFIEMEDIAGLARYPYKGFMGKGFAEVSTIINKVITIPVTVKKAGSYMVFFRYANGNGPVNTENKCAMRTLKINNVENGVFVFPQRGKEEWSNWGYSNSLKVSLKEGVNKLVLSYEPFNENMNGEINQAILDQVFVSSLD